MPDRVFRCIALTARSLKGDFGIAAPRIKVCGLNPHAGEQGVMGTEEEAVTEAIRQGERGGNRRGRTLSGRFTVPQAGL